MHLSYHYSDKIHAQDTSYIFLVLENHVQNTGCRIYKYHSPVMELNCTIAAKIQ